MQTTLVKTDNTCHSMKELDEAGIIIAVRTRRNRCMDSVAYVIDQADLAKALQCKGVTEIAQGLQVKFNTLKVDK